MNALPEPELRRRVVTYARVSAEDQKERETIRIQQEKLRDELATNPEVDYLREYTDDGISGTIAFGERPGGSDLLRDAARGLFEEVWVYRIDRLGRDDIDPLVVWRDLARLGVAVKSLTEGTIDPFMYHIRVAVAAEERRTMRRRMQDGTEQAAAEGRYTGGIIPYGYTLERRGARLHYLPNDHVVLPDLTEAGVVRHLFARAAVDRWTTFQIVDELNALGIAPPYTADGRTIEGKPTRGVWLPGSLLRMVKEPMYRGERLYGRRSQIPGRTPTVGRVPALVTDEVWYAAQETLRRNRTKAKNTRRVYLLRGVIHCASCGRTYCGTTPKDLPWYRCTGRSQKILGVKERCAGKEIKAAYLEPIILADLERFLRNPGELLAELEPSAPPEAQPASVLAATHYDAALAEREKERKRLLDLYLKARISGDEFEAARTGLDQAIAALEERLRARQPVAEEPVEGLPSPDLLAAVRRRLDEGLSKAEWQEIIEGLVRITAVTDQEGKISVTVNYRFPRPTEDSDERSVGDVATLQPRTVTAASLNYTLLRRTMELPSGRQKKVKR
jgi:site-specific DNA recombinase